MKTKRYNTGKPCKFGHLADRLVSNNTCVECTRLRKQQARIDNPQYMKNYRRKNFKKLAAQEKDWRKRNNNKVKKHHKDWKQKHRAHATAQERARQADKSHATPHWNNLKQIETLYEAANYLSRLTGFQWDVDHEYPIKSGVVCGLHIYENLQLLPHVTNLSKGNRILTATHQHASTL